MPVIENLLKYLYAKNYQDRTWLDKVIIKIKLCSFYSHGVFSLLSLLYSSLCICGE